MDPFFLSVIVYSFTFRSFVVLLVCCLLIMLSALVSASEVAFFSLSPKDLEIIQKKKTESNRRICKLIENHRLLLATILITNNFVNVSIVVLSAYFINTLFDFSQAHVLGFLIQTVVITFLLLFFGEIIPKVYASRHALKFSQLVSGFLTVTQIILKPFAKFLVSSTGIVDKRISKHNYDNLSIDELSHALELTTSEAENKDILQGIVRFSNVQTERTMTSRIDMTVIDLKASFKQVIETIVECGYSRIPVCAGSYDKIKGILYIKDLMPHLDKQNFKWQTLIRPAYFVPETKKISDLLADFQNNKIHMAIVVDEFGGTSGLITMEDILEEIVGEINDEYDEDETLYTKIDDHTYVFEAKILLNDFYKVIEVPETEFQKIDSEADTLAGLILELKGEIPDKGEVICYQNYEFKILSSDNRRIKKIKLHIKS